MWAATYSSEKNPVKSSSDEIIKKMLIGVNGQRVVDVGCGTGYFCHYAEKEGAKEVVGIDFSSEMIEQAKKNCKQTRFIMGDVRTVEFQESSAEILICALVLGHLENLETIILKFSKALAKNGVLVISDFHPFLTLNGQNRTFKMGRKHFEVPHYLHMLHDYINLLTQSGFVIEQMEEPTWKGTPVIFVLKARKS